MSCLVLFLLMHPLKTKPWRNAAGHTFIEMYQAASSSQVASCLKLELRVMLIILLKFSNMLRNSFVLPSNQSGS